MARIAKPDVNSALAAAAKTIVSASGGQSISRADLKKALARKTVPKNQRALVDIFFKFIEESDLKEGASVTAGDVDRAVAFAKKHLVEKYDLEHNAMSKEELEQMATTGKRTVELAKALKAAVEADAVDADDDDTAHGEDDDDATAHGEDED